MGNFMIPVCCVCGVSAKHWHDGEWELNNGKQDFCPKHTINDLTQYYWGEEINNTRRNKMSWSIAFIGKPKQIVEAMQQELSKVSGASKIEYEQALPHLQSLVALNFAEPETEWNPSTMRISANGHGVFNEGKQVNNQLRVTIETLDGRLV